MLKDKFNDAVNTFREYPSYCIGGVLFVLLITLVIWDIEEGKWVKENGTVARQYEYTSYDTSCTKRDNKGNCMSSVTYPVEHYCLVVVHQGKTDQTEVTIFTYGKFPVGSRCQITYREGGVLGIHYFIIINDPMTEF